LKRAGGALTPEVHAILLFTCSFDWTRSSPLELGLQCA
jgi:hypothetical protein